MTREEETPQGGYAIERRFVFVDWLAHSDLLLRLEWASLLSHDPMLRESVLRQLTQALAPVTSGRQVRIRLEVEPVLPADQADADAGSAQTSQQRGGDHVSARGGGGGTKPEPSPEAWAQEEEEADAT